MGTWKSKHFTDNYEPGNKMKFNTPRWGTTNNEELLNTVQDVRCNIKPGRVYKCVKNREKQGRIQQIRGQETCPFLYSLIVRTGIMAGNYHVVYIHIRGWTKPHTPSYITNPIYSVLRVFSSVIGWKLVTWHDREPEMGQSRIAYSLHLDRISYRLTQRRANRRRMERKRIQTTTTQMGPRRQNFSRKHFEGLAVLNITRKHSHKVWEKSTIKLRL